MRGDLVDLMMVLHHETALAVLVSETGDKADAVWLPKSQIEIDETSRPGYVSITLPEWLADEKGLT